MSEHRRVQQNLVVFQIFIKGQMSDCDSCLLQQLSKNGHLCEGCGGPQDEGRRLKRREKNRVAAQKSRRRQTQRADLLHEACELLEQRNVRLRREVDSLSEEQRLLSEALTAHEPFCPIMHCTFASSTPSSSLRLRGDVSHHGTEEGAAHREPSRQA